MVSYKSLTLLQGIFILLCGISVLDFGLSFTNFDFSSLGTPSGLGFNELFFSSTNGIIQGTPLANNDWWNYFDFWGYMFILVALIQIIKAFVGKN
jgi:hypothetical protein